MFKKIVVLVSIMQYFFPAYLLAQEQAESLLATRSHFKTTLLHKIKDNDPITPPPPELFSIVKYPTSIGDMSAYLSKADGSNKKQAAIIWIAGGFPPGGMDASAWTRVSPSNDQSAKIYRQLGMVIMYPFLRGSGGNPGFQEGFLGEVDDVISALKYLQKVEYVDPNRIYLGGHSTGGTLALLVAALTDQFRAVFAFGPVADPQVYGASNALHDSTIELENKLRSPVNYLTSIKSPTYVIEGTEGNIDSLNKLHSASKNKNVFFLPIKGANHFETLAPINQFIAQQITGSTNTQLTLQESQVQSVFDDFQTSILESSDLQLLANIRRSGIKLNGLKTVHYYFLSRNSDPLAETAKELKSFGFSTHAIESRKDSNQENFYMLRADKEVNLLDLRSVFSISAQLTQLADKLRIQYDGWDIQ